MRRPVFFKIVAFTLLLLLAAWSADAAEITVKTRVVSVGSVVLLGDVASVRPQLHDRQSVDELKRLELFPAPSQGKRRLMRRAELRELIQLNGIDSSSHSFRGAAVTRIDPPHPRAALTATNGSPTNGSTPPPAAQPVQPAAKTSPAGKPLVVPLGNLPKGTILQPEQLELRTVVLETTGRHRNTIPVHELAYAVGKELTRPVQGGMPLDANFLTKPMLVRRGEVVTVIAKASGVQVKTTAKASENGTHGDLILLQTLTGRDRFAARVTGPQQVEIFVGGTVVSDPPTPSLPSEGPVSQSLTRLPQGATR